MHKANTAATVWLLAAIVLVTTGPSPARQHDNHATGPLKPDINYPGNDFHSFELSDPDPEICRQACIDDPRCRAFTFVHPGGHGEPAHCWLKDAVPMPQPDKCCVSGEIFREEPFQQRSEGATERGWCCARGEIFSAPRFECLEMGGTLHGDRAEAEQSCRNPHPEVEGDSYHGSGETDRAAAAAAKPPMETVSENQPISEFLLAARVLPLDPTDRWVKTGGPIGGLGYDVRFRANDPQGKQIMYVTDNYTGVNISSNGGDSWFAANGESPHAPVLRRCHSGLLADGGPQ